MAVWKELDSPPPLDCPVGADFLNEANWVPKFAAFDKGTTSHSVKKKISLNIIQGGLLHTLNASSVVTYVQFAPPIF